MYTIPGRNVLRLLNKKKENRKTLNLNYGLSRLRNVKYRVCLNLMFFIMKKW